MSLPRTAAAFAALSLTSCTHRIAGAPDLSVTDSWSRATVAGQSSAAAYFTVANRGDGDDRLVRVSTPIGQASLHSTSMAGGVMRMRPVAALVIATHSTVELKPGATHVMIMGLKQPLETGVTFPLTLTFDRSGSRTVAVRVRPETTEGPAK